MRIERSAVPTLMMGFEVCFFFLERTAWRYRGRDEGHVDRRRAVDGGVSFEMEGFGFGWSRCWAS